MSAVERWASSFDEKIIVEKLCVALRVWMDVNKRWSDAPTIFLGGVFSTFFTIFLHRVQQDLDVIPCPLPLFWRKTNAIAVSRRSHASYG